MPVLPAKATKDVYNPFTSLDWFAHGGFRYFQLAGIELVLFKIEPSAIKYSYQDEYLCSLPIGWSCSETLIPRDGKAWKALFYIYNNLSCSPTNQPKTSRAYCELWPFLSEEDTLSVPPPRTPDVTIDWREEFRNRRKTGPPGTPKYFQDVNGVRQGYVG